MTTMPTLPTGYESRIAQIERRRKLAETLMAQGLQGSGPNTMNIFQALAPVLGAFMSTRMDKQADRAQGEVATGMRTDYSNATGAMGELLKNLKPGDRQGLVDAISAARGSPWTTGTADTLEKTLTAQMGADSRMVQNGSRWQRQGNIAEGSPVEGKPTDAVIAVQDPTTGRTFWQENTTATASALNRQGMGDPAYESVRRVESPYQSATPLVPAMSAPAGYPTDPEALRQEVARRAGPGIPPPLGPDQFPPELPAMNPAQAPVGPPPAGLTVDGQPYWMVNGVAYDNPEGK